MHRAGRAPAAAAMALSMVAAACAPVPVPPPGTATPGESVTAPAVAAPTPPRPVRKPTTPQAGEPAPSAAVPGAAAPAVPGLEQLDGLDQTATLALLGAPRQLAESPPATIWRYITASCELDVYFYLDLRTNEMHALHYEVRSQDNDAAERTPQRCYEQLVSHRDPDAEPAASANPPR